MSETTETVDAAAEQGASAEAPMVCADQIRANVAAFRADDNASMMGGWTN